MKFYSILVKAGLQILVPVLDDNGFFGFCISPSRSANAVSFVAAMCAIPVIFLFQTAGASGDLGGVIAAKCLASVFSCFLGLADGIVTRTVQSQRLEYTRLQVMHVLAWAGAIAGGGLLVDAFGITAAFYAVAVLKAIAAVCLVVLGIWWPLARAAQANAQSGFCVGVTHLCINQKLLPIVCLFVVWGSCFVVIETFTMTQMDREFAFARSVTGLSSMLAMLAGIPIYARAPRLLAYCGHLRFMTMGVQTAIVFLLLHTFIEREFSWCALAIAPLRGIAYAAIWAAFMDMILHEVKNDFLASVQAIAVFAWFTLGNGVGYIIWTHLHDRLGASACYGLCAGVLSFSLTFMPRQNSNGTSMRRVFYTTRVLTIAGLAVCCVFALKRLQHNIPDAPVRGWRLQMFNETSLEFPQRTPMNVNATLQQNGGGGVQANSVIPGSFQVRRNPSKHSAPLAFNVSRALTQKLQIPMHKTLHEFIQHRIAKNDPQEYAQFADRLWLNQWPKVARCGARMPKVLAFYDAHNVSLLGYFQAPASGAVVKMNHMAGSTRILASASKLSKRDLALYETLVLQTYRKEEPHYTFARHAVIIEEFISGLNGSVPVDYKSFAFDGEVAMVRIDIDRHCKMSGGCTAFTRFVQPTDFKILPFSHYSFRRFDGEYHRPCGWEATMQAVRCLSAGVNFARVDMYIVNCEPYLGEFTMTPCGGCEEVKSGGSHWLASFISSVKLFPHGKEYALI